MIVSPNKWLVCYQSNPGAKVNLICFPYGGGAASAYRLLAQELQMSIRVWCVQLPGRESRFAHPFVVDARAVVQSVADEMNALGIQQYSLFGHSMGSDLAVEFYRLISAAGKTKPDVMILSGNKPPHMPHDKLWSKVSDRELLEHVISLGGIPEDAANDKDFAELYLSKIRHDYTLYESVCIPSPIELSAKLMVLYGADDPLLTKTDMSEWAKYASAEFALKKLAGDHFYFQNDVSQLAANVRQAVLQ